MEEKWKASVCIWRIPREMKGSSGWHRGTEGFIGSGSPGIGVQDEGEISLKGGVLVHSVMEIPMEGGVLEEWKAQLEGKVIQGWKAPAEGRVLEE